MAHNPIIEDGKASLLSVRPYWGRIKMKKLLLFTLALLALALCSVNASGEDKNKNKPELAPLPSGIIQARNVFLLNGGGNDPSIKDGSGNEIAFDTVYSELKSWGRFRIVDSVDAADLVVEVTYGLENQRTRVFSSTNYSTGHTQVFSRNVADPTLRIMVYDAKTKEPLWSQSIVRKWARFGGNREKNLIKATKTMVERFRKRFPN